jgi:hypothetical protein
MKRRNRMISPWLVRTIDGRVRVKGRDSEDDLCDQDFDTEAEARAYGGSLLEFGPDIETAFLRAREMQKQDPSLTPEEAFERAGIVSITKGRT